jgi:ADP-ribosylglycohydrolase
MTKKLSGCALLALVFFSARGFAVEPTFVEIPANVVEDKIRGGMLAQIIGNLNGLPHEFKYIAEPGNVERYTPSLPKGAFTDDDTDIEWIYLHEIAQRGTNNLAADQIVQLWKRHINRRIFCANRYARDLMDLGIEPPWTGNVGLNPWAEFNISGQFICESFGLMAPAMPQTAARLGLRYTHVAIDGEPAQTTQLFTTMIAVAFVETDVDTIIDAGVAAVDSKSDVAKVVTTTRKLCREHPEDWRAARREIKKLWQQQGGIIRERNGYELNTACTIAALIYGRKDFTETLRTAFNFGWDADNNAATSATIVGVMKGRRWINDQGWTIKDVYRNTTRDNMPSDETLTNLENKLIEASRITIKTNGGQIPLPFNEGQGEGSTAPAKRVYRIPTEQPANVEPLTTTSDQLVRLREYIPVLKEALDQSGVARARTAYVAICLGEADKLARESPDAWQAAVTELQEKHPAVVRDLFHAPAPQADALRQRATQAGLHDPEDFKPTERPLEE